MKYLFLLTCIYFANIVNASDSSFIHKVFVFDIVENEDGYLIKGVDYNIMDTIQILSEKIEITKKKSKLNNNKYTCLDSISINKQFLLSLKRVDIYKTGAPLEIGKYAIGMGKTIVWRYGIDSINDIPYFLYDVDGLCIHKKSAFKTCKKNPRL